MTRTERQNATLRQALHLIKIHIDPSVTVKEKDQDRDLHNAIQLIVNVCRENGLLEVASTAKFYNDVDGNKVR